MHKLRSAHSTEPVDAAHNLLFDARMRGNEQESPTLLIYDRMSIIIAHCSITAAGC